MKVIILGGFLGAGKTTVLMQLARYLVEHTADSTMPVVILENEISENGVDNQLLSRSNFTVENMFSGCICCTSAGQLSTTIQVIEYNYHPEWLIIEATGMAYPDSILETIRRDLHREASVLAVVDTKRWRRTRIAMEQFITAQLCGADVILMTKIDAVDACVVEDVKKQVKEYAPECGIFPICAIEPIGDDFWAEIVSSLEGGCGNE